MPARLLWFLLLGFTTTSLVAQLGWAPAAAPGRAPGVRASLTVAAGGGGQEPPARRLVPGVDGPLAQAPDGQPGTPFVLDAAEARTTAEIVAEQAQADRLGPRQAPEREEYSVPWRRSRPQNAASPDLPSWPPGAADVGPSAPTVLTPNFSFDGPNLTATLAFPPDTMGDIGPTQYFVTLNGRMRVYNKTTTAQEFDFDPDVFFSSTVRGGAFTTDPRIRYDRLSQRWFIVYITIALPNRVVIAMSNSGTITAGTVWSYSFINDTVTNDDDEPCLGDYETLGIDNAALYIGVNQFCGLTVPTLAFFNTSGFVVNKANLIAGSGSVTLLSPLLDMMANEGPFTPQGADNVDPASTLGYFVGVDAFDFGELSIIRVANPAGTPSGTRHQLTVPATSFPIEDVPHSGGTKGLDGLDDRTYNAVVRGGRLYTAHTIGVNQAGAVGSPVTRNAARWYEIESLATTPALRQAGTIFDTAATSPLFFWVPSINVNAAGDIVVGYSQSSSTTFAGAGASHRRAGDALGTMQPRITVVNGAAAYNPAGNTTDPFRWGDYSMVSVDPADDATFWTAQMYTQSTNIYGTRVINLTVSGGGGTGPPGAPGTPAITGSGNTVVINWTAPITGGAPTSYTVLARLTPGGPIVASLPVGNVLTFTVTAPPGTFVVSVQASNAAGPGPESAGTSITVPILVPLPGPPTNLAAGVSGSTVTFTWTPPATGGPATGYLLVASLSPGGALIAQLPFAAPATTATVTSVPPGVYFVRLAATNAGGAGPFSNEVTVAVAGPQVPGAPTLSPAAVSGGTVALSWTPAATGGVPTSFLITASFSPGGAIIASLPVGGTSVSVPAPSGTYFVQVRGVNAVGAGPPSNEIMVVVP